MLPRHLSQVSLVYVNKLMIHQVSAELAWRGDAPQWTSRRCRR